MTLDIEKWKCQVKSKIEAGDDKGDQSELFRLVQNNSDAGRAHEPSNQHPKTHLSDLLVDRILILRY